MMSYFAILLIHLFQSNHCESPLIWVHTDVVKQINSVTVYWLVPVTIDRFMIFYYYNLLEVFHVLASYVLSGRSYICR